jgi:predicted PhzF superfamily epimerase YddE/YHI9
MGQPFCVVDAFTDRPFAGNPAAVCVMAGAGDEGWMLAVAREMNLSETAFLHPEGEGYRLRWFTPAVEMRLCGHATLASAHVLYETGQVAPGAEILFETLSGRLSARRDGSSIVLDFPAKPIAATTPPAGLMPALGAEALFVGEHDGDFLVELASPDIVRALTPDFRALARLPVRGVIVTAVGSAPYDFISRFFDPGAGIDEDPVTGASHCALGPFWGARLGKTELAGYQASARGGVVRVRCRGERVDLVGQAVTVSRGEILSA